MAAYLGRDHAERAFEAAPARCFDEVNDGIDMASGEKPVVQFVGRNGGNRRTVDRLE